MANPFYNSAPAGKPNGMNIMDIYKVITTSKNPMQVFNAMAMNNPQMAPVVNMLNNGGFFGNNNLGYRPATAEDVNNGFNFNDLQNQNRDIINAISAGTAQSVATTNQVYHDIVGALNDKYSELQRDVAGLAVGQANLLAKENECCCATLRAIDGVNYNNAMNTAAVKEAILLDGQKTRELITNNKMEAMQDRINKLELANAVAGVVKYPTSTAYNAGPNPCFNCGCGNI